MQSMNQDLRSGVYQHYTGLMILVLGVARHSETEEKFVVYVPLGPKAGPRMTVRPLKMFLEEVEVDGQTQSRFKFIGTEMPEDLAEKYQSTEHWGLPGKKD